MSNILSQLLFLPCIYDYTLLNEKGKYDNVKIKQTNQIKNNIVAIFYTYKGKDYYYRKDDSGYDYIFNNKDLQNIEKVTDINKLFQVIDNVDIKDIRIKPYKDVDKWRIANHLYIARLALSFIIFYSNMDISTSAFGYHGILETYLREFFLCLAYIIDNGKNNATTKAIRQNLRYKYPESVDKIIEFRDKYFAHNDNTFDYSLILMYRDFAYTIDDLQRLYQNIRQGCIDLCIIPQNFNCTNANYHPDLYRIRHNIRGKNEKVDIDTNIATNILLKVLPKYIVDSYKTGLNIHDRLHRLQIMCINHNIHNKTNFYVTYSMLKQIEEYKDEQSIDIFLLNSIKGN